MITLPKIPYKMAKNKRQVIALRGINYSNMLTDGDMADSKNVSARAYPYITTRKSRASMGDYSGVTAMTVFRGKFVTVKGSELYYDGKSVGKISPGEKQFAAVNTKLCIMPDKKYLDGETLTIHDMGAEIFSKGATFTKSSVTLADTSYSVASGDGSFSGNVFTSGQRVIWDHQADLYTDNTLVLFETAYCSVTDSHTVHIKDFPGDIADNLEGQFLSLTTLSYDAGYVGIGKIKSAWAGDNGIYVYVSDTIYSNSANAVRCKITFDNIFKAGDSLSFTVGGVTRVRALATSNKTIDTEPTEKNLLGVACEIKKELFPDLTTIFEVGWSLSFYGNSSGVVTGLTHNTITIDTAFTTAENKYTNITRIGSGLEVFKVGDFVTISNSANNNVTFGIDKIEGKVLYAENEIFTEGEDSNVITVERRIPDLDFICESENRLWGCSNKEHTIYASALGDPTNFFDFSGESTDSYAVAVGSEDDFTACVSFGNAVLFFKELKLHKVLGSYPAEYSLYSYDVEGVQAGCHKSLQIINEVLYYKGVHGVFAFNGSPSLISSNFGEKVFYDAVGGNDGDTYYISMNDGIKDYLFTYETKTGIWVLEDSLRVTDFARISSNTYALCEGGEFFLCGAGDSERGIEWLVQFTPFYESMEGHKSYSRMVFRLEIPQGSYMIVDVKTDDGAWREAGKVVGKRNGIVPVSVPINRCDKFEIRLRGKGKATIHSMMREFFVGGDK